jgi:histidinol-phosphate aminotransferase
MTISRRRLLERLGAGAAIAVTAPRLAGAFHGAPNGRAASDTIRSGATIRLHRNENVLGPSPNVIAAMRSAAEQAPLRYPDVEAEALRRKIAAVHGVPLDRVVLGCGAGDILRMAIDAFVGAHKTIVAAAPTFEALGEYARRAGAGIVGIPLRKDHSHDVGAMLARTDAA